ncbi:MAG: hypothetical protein AAF633_11365, partial [Chloroflexota bacterium]
MNKAFPILFLSILLVASGCQLLQQQGDDAFVLPTLIPTAAVLVATLEPEPDPLIGENGLPITNTPPPLTETPTLTPSPDPRTPTSTPTPDYSIVAAINITTLTRDEYAAGETVTLSGRATLRSDQRLIASLNQPDGTLLTAASVETLNFGSWEVTLPISDTLGGH